VNATCKGRLEGLINESKTNDTLRYIQGLFDVEKFVREHPKTSTGEQMDEHKIPNVKVFRNLKAIVDEVIHRSKYNKVDLGALFSFMD